MKPTASIGVLVLAAATLSTGCGSEPAASAKSAAPANVDPGSPEETKLAMAGLEKSASWFTVSCRWLESGAHVLAYPQDTAVLQAASSLGYIELTAVGQGNRTGNPETAWRVALTDSGKAEAKTCPPTSKSTSFGLPVTRRRIIAGTYTGPEKYGRSNYEVEYAWEPTPLGDRVKYELTDHMKVEEGVFKTKVIMERQQNGKYNAAAVGADPGANRGSR